MHVRIGVYAKTQYVKCELLFFEEAAPVGVIIVTGLCKKRELLDRHLPVSQRSSILLCHAGLRLRVSFMVAVTGRSALPLPVENTRVCLPVSLPQGRERQGRGPRRRRRRGAQACL